MQANYKLPESPNNMERKGNSSDTLLKEGRTPLHYLTSHLLLVNNSKSKHNGPKS